MRVIIQRVSAASVTVEGQVKGAIQAGLMVLLGIQNEDTQEDIQWIATKLVQLRIFDDAEGVMNLSVKDIGGSILLISQFTLYAATKKGNRPSYIAAAKPEIAVPIYEAMIQQLNQELGTPIATGVFGADMQVTLTNNGPVTIFIDSKNRE
jgi:D-tyrosyl-tRNA(Tyr) deacylase